MKLATFIHGSDLCTGAVVDDTVVELAAALKLSGRGDPVAASSVKSLLAGGPDSLGAAQEAVQWAQEQGHCLLSLADITLQAPIPCPGKLMCLAGNFADHILEGGGTFPGKEKMIPRFFMKPCTAVIGTGDMIRVPASTKFADWELELAIVVGHRGRDFTLEEAQDAIVGYTIFNDISARELTFRDQLPIQEGDAYFDWLVGKWLDTFGPMGPWITTADEISDPTRLRMQLFLNDELQQDASSGQMIFSPAEALVFITQFVTIEPGDIISMGTPAGVGHSKKVRLQSGDRIRGEIAELGVLENSVDFI